MSACRRMQLDLYLSHHTKLKSKWLSVLNIKPDGLKLREKKIGNSLESTDMEEELLNRMPMVHVIKSTIN